MKLYKNVVNRSRLASLAKVTDCLNTRHLTVTGYHMSMGFVHVAVESITETLM